MTMMINPNTSATPTPPSTPSYSASATIEPHLVGRAVGADGVNSRLQEVLDPDLDGVADRADLHERLVGGVGDVPVLDHRRDVWALRAAGERDCPVGVQLHLHGQPPRFALPEVDPDLA